MAVLANVLSHAKNSDRFSEVRIFWNGDDIFAVPLGMGDRINLRKPQNAGR